MVLSKKQCSPPSWDVWYEISHAKIILEVEILEAFESVICLPAVV